MGASMLAMCNTPHNLTGEALGRRIMSAKANRDRQTEPSCLAALLLTCVFTDLSIIE